MASFFSSQPRRQLFGRISLLATTTATAAMSWEYCQHYYFSKGSDDDEGHSSYRRYRSHIAYAGSVTIFGGGSDDAEAAGNNESGGGGILRSLSATAGNLLSEDSDGCCSLVSRRSLGKLREFLGLDEDNTPAAVGGGTSGPSSSSSVPRLVLANLYGQAGVTPIMIAAFNGDDEFVDILLNAAADPDMRSCLNPKEENSQLLNLQVSGTSVSAKQRNSAEWGKQIATRAPGALTRAEISRDVWQNYFKSLGGLSRAKLEEGFNAADFALLGGHLDTAQVLVERGAAMPREDCVKRLAIQMCGGTSADMVEKHRAEIILKLEEASQKSLDAQRKKRAQFPLETRLHENIVGQQHAVGIVSSAIRRKENGWFDSDSPLVMLFMGSSGIGKTETAKLVARYLFAPADAVDPFAASSANARSSGRPSSALNAQRDRKRQADEEDAAITHPVLKQISTLSKRNDKSSSTQEDGKPQWEKCFIRMDMTEYQSKHEVSKFIGAPPGYVGYDEGGQLVKKLKECPNAVVLLDEVEKAHPDVLTVMLQAFDEGRLTDGQGETVDCKDATFIMTSNLAQQQIADEAVRLRDAVVGGTSNGSLNSHTSGSKHSIASVDGLTKRFKRSVVQPILRRHFGRDEFLGRINEIVFFLPFTMSEQQELARKELEKWQRRAMDRHRIELKWDPAVEKQMALGYNLRYGARSIKYEIDRTCIASVARAQEEGQVTRGSRVELSLEKTALKAFEEKMKKMEEEQVKRAKELLVERKNNKAQSSVVEQSSRNQGPSNVKENIGEIPPQLAHHDSRDHTLPPPSLDEMLAQIGNDDGSSGIDDEVDVVVPIIVKVTPNVVPLNDKSGGGKKGWFSF